METNSNILNKWNSKFRASIRNKYVHTKYNGTKPHSAFTVLAIFSTNILFIILKDLSFEGNHYQIFWMILKGLNLLTTISVWLFVLYYWREFLNLRREGFNNDKNLFFAESAGFRRKLISYLALVPWFIINIRSHFNPQDMGELRYQLRADFYRAAGITVLKNILFSILIVEISRFLFPTTFSWTNKKHMIIVILVSFAISVISVIGLNAASGHGII